MKTNRTSLYILIFLASLAACSSPKKEIEDCTDAECARAATVKTEPTPSDSAPGTITVVCGVFKPGVEAAVPCESVLIKVFVGDSAKPKKQWTLSGEKLVIPEIAPKEKVSLNLTLQGCSKPNLLPGLKSGDTRETYFKLPCR
jgi:hypothetical protein